MKLKRAIVLLLPLAAGAAVLALLAGYLRAAEDQTAGSAGRLVVVADTTASMQPELAALSAAWPGSVIPESGKERTYHLLQFKDQVRYEGSTGSISEFQAKLDELTAIAGGDCEDAMFQALAAAARGVPDSRALVLSDAAPMGSRANFAFIMNKLVERGINIYPVISGWCQDSELSQSAMFSLARMTGGVPFIQEVGVVPTENETQSSLHSAFDMMALQDSLLVENSTLDGIKTFPLTVDSTATTLGVDEEKCRVWCLTCTLAVQQAESLVSNEDISLMVKDPDGNLLQAGDAGVEIRERSSGSTLLIDVADVYTPPLGQTSATWEIIVQGSGDFVLNASADSGVHLDYDGRHTLPANREIPFRAALSTSGGAPDISGETVQFALKHIMNGSIIPVELFDDGSHDDGAAGDGIFAGPVTLKRGLWYLVARGELADGAQFERTHTVPIRAKGFRANKPADNQQVAGSSGTLRFEISNDDPPDLQRTAVKAYDLDVESLLGWASSEGVPSRIVLQPGETKVVNVQVIVPDDAEAGDEEETFLTIIESDDIGSSETLTVKTTVVDELKSYLPAALGN
ncbi:MAG: choice-of-anchor X domain-containing protein [Candidatus Promineifilaceae bacterium]